MRSEWAMGAGTDGKKTLKVISASRRVDMVTRYRDEFLRLMAERWPQELAHTVVVWTKHPARLAEDGEILRFLSRYSQVFLHLTVTGLGGSVLEPGADDWRTSVAAIPELVRFCRSPERIRFRFDPLIEVETAAGEVISNVGMLEEVVAPAIEAGVRNVSTSWVTSYAKVTSRLASFDMRIRPRSRRDVVSLCEQAKARIERLGGVAHFCCVPGLPRSSCIDGRVLSGLHPGGLVCSTAKAGNQRPLCGCTESVDIGWYKSCKTGCLYCYANPAVVRRTPCAR